MKKCKWVLILMSIMLPVFAQAKAVGSSTRKMATVAKVRACPSSIVRVSEGVIHSSNFNLCGVNQQSGVNTFVYSTECCEKNKDKECVSERQCRRAMANCIQRDDKGEIVSMYKAYGVKDCGACGAVGSNGAAVVLAP